MSKKQRASSNGVRNALLSALDAAEFRRLRPQMEEVEMDFKQLIYEQNRPVKDVFFPNSGMVSMVTVLDEGMIETGTVGCEGMTGVPAALVGGASPGRAFCQIPGRALRMPVSILADERERGGSALLTLVLRYMNFMFAMLGQSAACNRMHTVEARMAKWLLMTHDRVDEEESFPLTQEFLGQMLGVQRPTINTAGATLQRAGYIKYSRGRIAIVDRKGLEDASCECYSQLKTQLTLSMG
jgi:CRP-like cAMP-binding protein